MRKNRDHTRRPAPDQSEPTTPTEDDGHGVNRREFVKASVAGAGALALTGALPACIAGATQNPTPAPSERGSGRQQDCVEDWSEPWEWDVREHPGDELQLRVTEYLMRSLAPPPEGMLAAGAPRVFDATLFGYDGKIPGPTVRMGGNDIFRLHLINTLDGNLGTWAHSQGSRFAKKTRVKGTDYPANAKVPDLVDWELSGTLIYGPHQQNTTNFHTHGLHVSPVRNPDGTHSDNVLMRIIPEKDGENRDGPTKIPLDGHEFVGDAHYEFQLGSSSGTMVDGVPIETHPPGTHWYHPHPHGATYDQVASGMAGLLIVEGDVDEALKEQIKGYKERLMIVQRVLDTGGAPLSGLPRPAELPTPPTEGSKDHINTVNGMVTTTSDPTEQTSDDTKKTMTLVMRPGAIERWRILNGSVDGKGFIRIVVVAADASVPAKGSSQTNAGYAATLEAWANQHGQRLDQLAFDGITLVTPGGDYTTVPLKSLVMAPANRADFLFQAPAEGTYQIFGLPVPESSTADFKETYAIRIAYLCVQDDAFDPGIRRDSSGRLELRFPPVPRLITPIRDDEVLVGTEKRARRVIYSGWGGSYARPSGCSPPPGDPPLKGFNSMVIDRRKFDPDLPVQKMLLGTVEEWTLDNYSVEHGTVDHPFHMHQNPFWVMRIEDIDGNDVGPKDEQGASLLPRWQDVVAIPRDGGRVVFRSRFWDYHGSYVNHCHILQHEDWGMMQTVEIVTDEGDANCPLHTPDFEYPRPTPKEMTEFCEVIHTEDGQRYPDCPEPGGAQ